MTNESHAAETYYNTGFVLSMAESHLEQCYAESQKYPYERSVIPGVLMAATASETFINELVHIAADYCGTSSPLVDLASRWHDLEYELGIKGKYSCVWDCIAYSFEDNSNYDEFKLLIELRNSIAHSRVNEMSWDDQGRLSDSNSRIESLLDSLEKRSLYTRPNAAPVQFDQNAATCYLDPTASWIWRLQRTELLKWGIDTANDIIQATIDLMDGSFKRALESIVRERSPSPRINFQANAVVMADVDPNAVDIRQP